MIKGIRTPNNLYILKGGQQQCYLSKNYEHWLCHRTLGHLRFSQIIKQENSRLFLIFLISTFQKIQYGNHVNLVSKLGHNSLKRKDQLVSLLNLFILIYVVHEGKSHLVERNTLYCSLMIFPECVG